MICLSRVPPHRCERVVLFVFFKDVSEIRSRSGPSSFGALVNPFSEILCCPFSTPPGGKERRGEVGQKPPTPTPQRSKAIQYAKRRENNKNRLSAGKRKLRESSSSIPENQGRRSNSSPIDAVDVEIASTKYGVLWHAVA
ncbi:Hairy/enhancer-of-split related with YRPW motif protein 2 [Anopheles sinensis]|uniref:Hairy/enhancer-of-split related with YRPW motif protein 2 n=1 Tax=Anopheles sinensis TaxID=74873 RepID=A0A084VPU8_ANOSI|nr:Hairy/enhancer-of-split related with YRPW motif protein 2 [Anopheles sinensis]